MKKIIRVLALTLAFAVLCSSFATIAYAKELASCGLCNTTGEFHCKVCNNTGEVTCGVCGGEGKSKCTGESGKGCDDGYYTCPSCNGDGKNRSGDGKNIEGVCGNCGGAGKLRCVVCSNGTPGWNACTRCGGSGKHECQVGTCKVSRQYGWHCPDCKGTGFILVGNPMPPKENNDGVRNVPVKGDYIVTNDKTWAGYTYGGESGGNDSQSTPSENTTPPVTTDPGPVQTEPPQQNDTPPDQSENKPPVTTDPGPSKTEPPQQNDNPPDQSENNQPGTDFPPADMTLLPEDRNSDFDIPLSNEPDRTITSSVRVEMGKMTDEEQKYYAGLPEEELAQILTNVRTIVASAEPGRSDSKTDELLNSLATQNGYGSLPEGRLFPLYFEGHQEIGFPVHVTVSVEKGLLDGGTDLYVYHIAEDGIIELLGKAEYGTYEDGTIENISFYTSSFSTFFTSAKELDTDISVVNGDSESTDAMGSTGENETPLRFWIVLFAVMTSVIAVVIVGTIVVRKKRKKE